MSIPHPHADIAAPPTGVPQTTPAVQFYNDLVRNLSAHGYHCIAELCWDTLEDRAKPNALRRIVWTNDGPCAAPLLAKILELDADRAMPNAEKLTELMPDIIRTLKSLQCAEGTTKRILFEICGLEGYTLAHAQTLLTTEPYTTAEKTAAQATIKSATRASLVFTEREVEAASNSNKVRDAIKDATIGNGLTEIIRIRVRKNLHQNRRTASAQLPVQAVMQAGNSSEAGAAVELTAF